MKVLDWLFFVILTVFCLQSKAQTINGYGAVTGIGGTVMTISSPDESGGTFEDGDEIIIMQMQDDVIGSNTADNASFGLIDDIESAGLYEIATISSHTEDGGSNVTSITVSAALTNTYNIGANTSVQVITFPELGTPDYTIGNTGCKDWNGTIGGVLAFQVSGTLTINGNLDVSEAGFRGASPNGGGSTGCTGASNYRVASTANFADKGEGIYKRTDANYAAGFARIASGGGGGNSHNAGGGGGGNYSAGGLGGPGWPTCSPSAGGGGGVDLSAHISASRVFLGGGAGAGEANNGGSQKAGDGGGIILMKAGTIETTGASGMKYIRANGESVTVGSGNDGNSGGGAGGSIVIGVGTWDIAAGTPISLESNGGNGGDVTHAHGHGAGGGGGQGTIIYSISEPSANTTTNTVPGVGGLNCNTCVAAAPGGGVAGAGVKDDEVGPLPVELIHFGVEYLDADEAVEVVWQTASEINSAEFQIEKSRDGNNWDIVGTETGAGNSSHLIDYHFYDFEVEQGRNYYRLKQIDFDGTYEYFATKYADVYKETEEISVYPNPSNGIVNYAIPANLGEVDQIKVINYTGEIIESIVPQSLHGALDLRSRKAGIYQLVFEYPSGARSMTVIVQP